MASLVLIVIYLALITMGFRDALLGAAWPAMYTDIGTSVSALGVLSMLISIGTVLSSLLSARVTSRFGTGKVAVACAAMATVALFGFSISTAFWMLCLWAVPYGMGAGCLDVAMNNYVATHYPSRHTSWIHCAWGLGATLSPYLMGYVLTVGQPWNAGFRYVGLVFAGVLVLFAVTLPMWKKPQTVAAEGKPARPLPVTQLIRISGAKHMMIVFFCYCAIEHTAMLWSSSYLVLHKGIDEATATSFAGLFSIGITVGRALSGFMTMRFSDKQMIRIGQSTILLGVICMLLPLGDAVSLAGLVLIGLGCAPVYPCCVHATPHYFGVEHSQALLGIFTAIAFFGTSLMPTVFSGIAEIAGVGLMPLFMLVLLGAEVLGHEALVRKLGK